ncbi:MAG: MFS transporter [Thermoleophilaceae bacterium]|nr:MFS transporter [Thermoleophilaceae bacterium]
MRSVLRTPGVPRLFGAFCVAALPTGALGLLIVLHTQALTGSYGLGGLTAGAYALALGVSGPLLARVVDRRGQTLVLRAGAAVTAGAIAALAALPDGAPFALVLIAAALAGVAQPPVSACMRALWPDLVPDPDGRHAAYSLETVVLELVYICGPGVIVAGIGSWSIRAALAACAALVLCGNLAFAADRASRAWRPHRERPGGSAGALAAPGVRLIVVVFALAGLAVGAVDVAVPAILTPLGQRDLTGVMLALWGAGSVAAGTLNSRARAATRPARRLALLMAGWGAIHGAVGLGRSPVAVGLLLLAAGATIAPTFVCANGMLDRLAPTGTLTEAFTWLSTGLSVGIAAGSALAGALVDAASPALALAVCGAAGLVGALLVAAGATGPLAASPPLSSRCA